MTKQFDPDDQEDTFNQYPDGYDPRENIEFETLATSLVFEMLYLLRQIAMKNSIGGHVTVDPDSIPELLTATSEVALQSRGDLYKMSYADAYVRFGTLTAHMFYGLLTMRATHGDEIIRQLLDRNNEDN